MACNKEYFFSMCIETVSVKHFMPELMVFVALSYADTLQLLFPIHQGCSYMQSMTLIYLGEIDA